MAFIFTRCDAGQDGSMCAGWAGATLLGTLKFSRGSHDRILHLIYEKKYFRFCETESQREFCLGFFLQSVFSTFKDNFYKFKTLSNNSAKVSWQRFYVRGVARHST